jgi:dGTPase
MQVSLSRYHSRGSATIDKGREPETPEGQVVMWSDKLVYTCSDIDDALRVGIIKEHQLPTAEIRLLGDDKSDWIGSLNKGLVLSSVKEGRICFEGEYREAFDTLRNWMYKNVYGHGKLKKEFKKDQNLVELVFNHVMENEFNHLSQDDAAYATLDRVACMTDVSIIQYMDDHYRPRGAY